MQTPSPVLCAHNKRSKLLRNLPHKPSVFAKQLHGPLVPRVEEDGTARRVVSLVHQVLLRESRQAAGRMDREIEVVQRRIEVQRFVGEGVIITDGF